MNFSDSEWNHLLAGKQFWSFYYRYWNGMEKAWADSAFSNTLDRLYGEKQENFAEKNAHLTLTFKGEYTLRIIFYGSETEGSTERYELLHPEWEKALVLGHDSPHFSLPIFHWDEIMTLSQHATSSIDKKYLPLLLIKTMKSVPGSETEKIRREIVPFVEAIEALQENQEEFLQQMLWWNQEFEWEYTDEFGWINPLETSLRKPSDTSRKLQVFLKSLRNWEP